MYSEEAAGGSMDVDASVKELLTRVKHQPRQYPGEANTPYIRPRPQLWLPYTKSDPDAAKNWGHDLYGNTVKGGNLAHRLQSASSSKPLDLGGKDLLDDDLDLGRNGAGAGKKAPPPSGPRSAGAGSLASRVGGVVAGNGRAGGARAATAPAVSAGRGVGLSIKGQSSKTIVEVSNLAAGTTAEDVQMTFESFGPILSSKLGPKASFVTVILEFSTTQAAQASISAYDGQIADGRTISVKFKALPSPTPPAAPARSSSSNNVNRDAPRKAEPSLAGGLLGRLGMPAAVRVGGARREVAAVPVQQQQVDLMAGLGGTGMYSDSISDPRASIQTVPGAPSSASASSAARTGRGGGGRGRGNRRGGRGQGVRGVGGMQVD